MPHHLGITHDHCTPECPGYQKTGLTWRDTLAEINLEELKQWKKFFVKNTKHGGMDFYRYYLAEDEEDSSEVEEANDGSTKVE